VCDVKPLMTKDTVRLIDHEHRRSVSALTASCRKGTQARRDNHQRARVKNPAGKNFGARRRQNDPSLRKKIIKHAAGYGERKGISYAAWRSAGVSAQDLKDAGIRGGAP
jgi:hypothetical protein